MLIMFTRRKWGPSPRGRGRLARSLSASVGKGTIPAWAGETGYGVSSRIRYWDHPRVGGGDFLFMLLKARGTGPSPRGRGRQVDRQLARLHDGTIPAWAGETRRPGWPARVGRDHPRVGGGDSHSISLGFAVSGPSPRGRGRREAIGQAAPACGTIPAWAGETCCGRANRSRLRDHPRVGGGDTISSSISTGSKGPSPRGRGRQAHRRRCGPRYGTIPAWAGETSRVGRPTCSDWDHPRVGGGDSPRSWRRSSTPGPSPRGRGRL